MLGETEEQRRRRLRNNNEAFKQRKLAGDGRDWLWYKTKKRAKRQGVLFTLRREDVPPIPLRCPVFGFKMSFEGSHADKENTPTLDRINNEKGYVRGNVAVVSWKANRIKQQLSIPELIDLANYYSQYKKQS